MDTIEQGAPARDQGQTFPLPLCHLFVVPSLHAWLGAVPTVAQPAARWGRRHACNLAELSKGSHTQGGVGHTNALTPCALPHVLVPCTHSPHLSHSQPHVLMPCMHGLWPQPSLASFPTPSF